MTRQLSPTNTFVIGFLLLMVFEHCNQIEDTIIVTDDILMLTRPATGLESAACADFPTNQTFSLAASNTKSVSWIAAKSLTNDTLKIIRLEILSDTGSVAKFTMTLRPLSGKPSEIQCMKGFGCTGTWENFPWVVPGENFLNQTVFKFKVKPVDIGSFTIENYNTDKALTVRVNPPI